MAQLAGTVRMSLALGDSAIARLEREFLKLHRKARARGLSVCSRPTILPTREFFPMRLRGDIASATTLAHKLAELCGVARFRFSVEEIPDVDATLRTALPRYSSERAILHSMLEVRGDRSFAIHVLPSVLADSKVLAAELLRRIAQVSLKEALRLSVGRANRSGFLVDLATVYLGCGIITANGAFEFRKGYSGTAYEWSVRRSGTLTEPEYGYALALYAAARGEKHPAWAKYLDADIRSAFRASEQAIDRSNRGDTLRLCPDNTDS